jgi:hypothetical protein
MSTFPMQKSPPKSQMILVLCAIALGGHTNLAGADDAIRWDLSAGDKLVYEIAKSSTLSFGDDSSAYTLTQTVNVTWRVLAANEAGVVTIEQAVDRIRLVLDDPLGDVRYDSDVDEEPGSLAALAATVFSAMLEHNIQFTLAPDGKIDQMNIPEPLLAAVENVSFAKSLDRFASDEGLQELLIPRLPVFPEGDLQPTQEWSTGTDQASGTHQVEITYRYTGERELDGQPLAAIEQTRTVTFSGESDAAQIQNQSPPGELLFDREAGRLISNHWKVELRVTDPAGQAGQLQQEFRMDLDR